MIKGTIFAASVLAVAATGALAQDNSVRWVYKAIGRTWQCSDWTGECGYRYTYGYRPQYATPQAYAPRVYGYHQALPRVDSAANAPRCYTGRLSVVGIEAFDKDKAKEQAVSAWAEAVRARIGGKFMDIRNADAVVYECWASATGNRASEKVADLGGKELHQCEITAQPCRAKQEVADGDDRVTDILIQRLQAQGYDVKLVEPGNADVPKRSRLLRRIFPKKDTPQ